MTRSKSGKSKPGRSKPGKSKPGKSKPGKSKPGRSKPGKSNPGKSKPGRSKPGKSKAVKTKHRKRPSTLHINDTDPTTLDSHYEAHHCSPNIDKLGFSCLSHGALVKIAKAINSLNGIELKYVGLSDEVLYKKICNVMQNNFNCKNEACWLNIRKLMNKLSATDVKYFRKHFRPKMPEDIIDDYTKWISNYDIEAVLKQHHDETPGVYSYGAIPIDFKSCSVSSDLCKINLKEHIDKSEDKLAMVFNTDDSKGPGQHWIAMYVDVNGKNLDSQPGIYFFDSFASKPMQEVTDLIDKLKVQGSKLNKEFIVTINDKSLQKNTFSCGFYSMHFIEHMIKETPFSEYINSGLTDKKMIEYRNHCYLHPDEIKC